MVRNGQHRLQKKTIEHPGMLEQIREAFRMTGRLAFETLPKDKYDDHIRTPGSRGLPGHGA
jgi:hypothetical protein